MGRNSIPTRRATERETWSLPVTDSSSRDGPPDSRREPVGAPVVRGDPEITGAHADEAAAFDPDDPESVADAVTIVREFHDRSADADHLTMLKGAAACAALVRGEGSYKAAATRADVPVSFLRKWARVHDLPISIRRHIARGEIAPSAAKHIARLAGTARFLVAWATIDHDLSVAEVRAVTSAVSSGTSVEEALEAQGLDLGRITVRLPADIYRELRRRASLANRPLDDLLVELLEASLSGDG